MPIETQYPTGLGTEDDWGLEGAASKLLAVSADDGDGSIVYANSGGAARVQRFTFPLLAGVADPVTAATLYAKVREYAPGAGGRAFYFQWNSAMVGSNLGPAIHVSGGYTTQSYAAGGAALAAVNGEHGFNMSAAGGPTQKWEVWCSLFYRSVNFTYAGGSEDHFGHLIGGLMGAIGAGLLLRDMPALALVISKQTGTLIKPSEYDEALRAWRRERHVAVV